LNFQLARDQVVLFETAANFCASQHQANIFFAVFFSIFELEGIIKHLMTGLAGNKLTVSLGASH